MPVDSRVKLGLAGLLAFEILVAVYTWSGTPTIFTWLYVVGAALLAYLLWRATKGETPASPILAVLAVDALVRAYMQTRNPGYPLGVLPTYLVPAGFAALAFAMRRGAVNGERVALAGVVLVALARSWFVYWYFQAGAGLLVLANILGAIGAWTWATALASNDAAPEKPSAPA